ncbi:hypothetical protein MCHK_2646 [Mesorhizobium huakuii 7653R]|nr:hypothetical protein MCHK_2646 [Mesorhizobium huakuii 7653R]
MPNSHWVSFTVTTTGTEFLDVRDVGLAPSLDHITVIQLDYEWDGMATSIVVAPEDIVLLTFGSQAVDMSVGSMTAPPPRQREGRSWALWKRCTRSARRRPEKSRRPSGHRPRRS